MKIFSGNAHPALGEAICKYLGMGLGQMRLMNFSDGESYCQILENVRGADTFFIQPRCAPVNQHLLGLLLMLDAFRRSSAYRVAAVPPYYGSPSRDRKDKRRWPIGST